MKAMNNFGFINDICNQKTYIYIAIAVFLIAAVVCIIKFVKRTAMKIFTVILCTWMSGYGCISTAIFHPQQLTSTQRQEFLSLDEDAMNEIKSKYSIIQKNGETYILEKLNKNSVFYDLQKKYIDNFKRK